VLDESGFRLYRAECMGLNFLFVQMTDVGGGEYRLTDRPKRLPHIDPCRRGGSSIARWE